MAKNRFCLNRSCWPSSISKNTRKQQVLLQKISGENGADGPSSFCLSADVGGRPEKAHVLALKSFTSFQASYRLNTLNDIKWNSSLSKAKITLTGKVQACL